MSFVEQFYTAFSNGCDWVVRAFQCVHDKYRIAIDNLPVVPDEAQKKIKKIGILVLSTICTFLLLNFFDFTEVANITFAAENTTFAATNTTFAVANTTFAVANTTFVEQFTEVANITFAAANTTFAAANTTFAAENTTFAAENTTFAAENTTISVEELVLTGFVIVGFGLILFIFYHFCEKPQEKPQKVKFCIYGLNELYVFDNLSDNRPKVLENINYIKVKAINTLNVYKPLEFYVRRQSEYNNIMAWLFKKRGLTINDNNHQEINVTYQTPSNFLLDKTGYLTPSK